MGRRTRGGGEGGRGEAETGEGGGEGEGSGSVRGNASLRSDPASGIILEECTKHECTCSYISYLNTIHHCTNSAAFSDVVHIYIHVYFMYVYVDNYSHIYIYMYIVHVPTYKCCILRCVIQT